MSGISKFLHRRILYPGILFLRGEYSLLVRLEELRQLQWRSPEAVRQYQAERLSKILEHALQTTEYYKRFGATSREYSASAAHDELATLPLLSKRDLQVFADRMLSDSPSGRVGRSTTGGSTGEPVTVSKDRRALAHERAAMWLGYEWCGIEIGDKAARFWGAPRNLKQRLRARCADLGMRRFRLSAFSFGEEELEGFWKECLRRRPDYFHGYVSMIDEFAGFIEARGLDGQALGLKAIVATSEVLGEPQRRAWEEMFGCQVQIEYGCGEVGPIAYECEAGSLHLMAPNLVVEFLDTAGRPVERGETGEIVLTDLENRAMPLLRYRVGDYGVPGEPCECGRGFPVLGRIWGREYDFVATPNGRKFHGEYFMYVFQDLKEAGHPVRQFQILQPTSDAIEVRVVLEDVDNDDGEDEIRESIVRMLDSGFQEMRLEVRSVERLERAPSGKMQVIRNNWLRERADRS